MIDYPHDTGCTHNGTRIPKCIECPLPQCKDDLTVSQRRMANNNYTEGERIALREEVLALRRQGIRWKDIETQTGISLKTLSAWERRYSQEGSRPPPQHHHVTGQERPKVIERIIRLRDKGWPWERIAAEVGVSGNTAKRWWQKERLNQ